MGEKPQHTDSEPARHLPEVDAKPIVSRRKRLLKIGMVVTGVAFLAATCGIKLLQKYEPGPKYRYAPPPALPTLVELAKEKGFPEACMTFAPNDDDVTQTIGCIYTGHPPEQPNPSAPCVLTITRVEASDNPYEFRVSAAGADGQPIALGRSPTFAQATDRTLTPNLPPACLPVNPTY